MNRLPMLALASRTLAAPLLARPFSSGVVLAAKKVDKKGKGAGAEVKKGPDAGGRDTTALAALNVTKTGPYSEDFPLWEDEKYPDWLWQLDKPAPNIEDLRKVIEEAPDLEEVESDVLRRYLKLVSRQKIKKQNAMSRKK